MKKINVKLKTKALISYPIFIDCDFSERIAVFLKKEFPESACVIITDGTVRKLYGEKLLRLLKKTDRKVFLFTVAQGERSKNQKNKTAIEEKMLRLRLDRKTVIIALGGGVPGDLGGFIAATYMRGIPYVQIPTTLLAMVDSSIGGKTGIDTPQGKNLIGAFWQPQAVFIGLNCLTTLPQKHLKNGLFEAIKMFATSDAASFRNVGKNIGALLNRNTKILTQVVRSAVEIKSGFISRDEHESGERMTLNFGHTIGHALERLSGYRMLHGYAIALGMLAEAGMARELGILEARDFLRLRSVLVDKMKLDPKSVHK